MKSDYTSLKASFSFSGLEAQDFESERGTFSWINMPNTVIGGNEGDPQIPVVNELIAVPFGAKPTIEVTSFSTTEYRLADYGIHTLVPRQPSLRKDKKPEEMPFVYNAEAYQARGLRSEPKAIVQVVGTMRGVQLGKMTIEPVSYDPVSNTLRVFNDIEVEVNFNGADAKATENMLVDTYSPYFDGIYKSLFNGRAILDAYTSHPDLYKTPVKMLVVATSAYQNSTAFQNWLAWKKQKGIYVDIYTVTSSTASSTIRSEIQSRYNANHPTFLVIVGDETVVKAYKTNWSCNSSYGNCINDLEYASIDSDVYHDMFMSRMSVSSTTELGNLVNKILTYEKYTMADPSYLNNSLLVAGWDSNWTNKVGKPTIQYANNNYYNAAHGITPTVYITTGSGQTAAYNNINNVGFLNYTAHGDIQELADPSFTNSNVSSMSNNGKYLWVVANCCLSANWGNSTYKPCLGETMIRAANKGAFGYIGSIPESYWYEDYYFGVGAFSYVASTVQTTSSTTTGMYDALFDDTGFNTLNSVPYIGNVAVTYAHAAGYTSSVTDEYYWRAYQCLGDGSVMPYLKKPTANTVSHDNVLPFGATSFTVSAVAGSYVAITVNNEIIGVAQVPSNGTVAVPITAQTAAGTAMIVVTRNQRQPYIANVEIVGEEHNITAIAEPEEGGTVTGAGTYYKGTTCTLTAIANHGYEFANWRKGDNFVTDSPTYTFTVTEDADYIAEFSALEEYTVECPETQHGTFAATPTTAYVGDTITLTATPEEGYCLAEWDVYTTSKESITVVNNQFIMPESDVTVNAIFLKGNNITIATAANGSVSCDYTLALEGTTVNLTAIPDAGYFLSSWFVYKTGDINTTVSVTGNHFTMPAYDVTVVALFVPATGGDTIIGSGNATSSNLPTNAFYSYCLTQQIYTADEVGQSGNITAIAFKVSNTKEISRTLEVYLRHTDKTEFTNTTDWESVSMEDKMFDGVVDFISSDWTTITLATPFSYDGQSNLLICVNDKSNEYVNSPSDAPKFLIYSTTEKRALYANDDNNAFSPTSSLSMTGTRLSSNNQIKITKAQPNTGGSITAFADALSGFTYTKGNGPSDSQHFSLIAMGNEEIVLSAPEHFEISTAANGSYTAMLSFPAETVIATDIHVRLRADLEVGNYENETLTIQCGDTFEEVTLSGEVTKNTYYTFNESSFPNNMAVMGVILIEGEEQRSEQLEIGAFCGEECRGAVMPMYCPPVDRYIVPLLVYGSSDEEIHFKLYDHETDMESELSCVTILNFNENGYGNIIDPILLNFSSETETEVTQNCQFTPGWHWWSTFVEISEDEGLARLQETLGASASLIKSSNSFISYTNGEWTGQLSNIDNESCYLILIDETLTTAFTGTPANPADHPSTINPGWNWIGYPCTQSMSIEEALAGFTPAEGDMIKSQNNFATFSNGKWNGALSTLEPGQGFLYLSNSGESKVLVFPNRR